MQSSGFLSGVEGYIFRMSYPHGWQVDMGCWQKVSFLCPLYVFEDYLSVLLTWKLTSSRVSDLKEHGGSQNVFYDQGLEVWHIAISTIFHWPHKSVLFNVEDYTRWEYQKMKNIEGPIGGWLPQQLLHLSSLFVRFISISVSRSFLSPLFFEIITPLWSLFRHVFPNYTLPFMKL